MGGSPSASTVSTMFWFALACLVLMPIPLLIGLILGGALSIVAAVLAVIALGARPRTSA